MISVNLKGRLGNQAFQMATCIAHAKRNGYAYSLPPETLNESIWPFYFEHLRGTKKPMGELYEEPTHEYSPIPKRDNLILNGYFQTEKYFYDYRKDILDAFAVPYAFDQGAISLHVRRGDYVNLKDHHPPCTSEYYIEALNLVTPGARVIKVFSDDIDYCRNMFPYDWNNIPFEYIEGLTPKEDLALMSGCEHNIIANSSFSWWGAWLGRNENKIVISPKLWFGEKNSHLSQNDIIPKRWIKI